jgi:hypothetical protein
MKILRVLQGMQAQAPFDFGELSHPIHNNLEMVYILNGSGKV